MSGEPGWGLTRGNGVGNATFGAQQPQDKKEEYVFPQVGVPQHLQSLLDQYAPLGGGQPMSTEQLYAGRGQGVQPHELAAASGKGGGGAPGGKGSGKGGGGMGGGGGAPQPMQEALAQALDGGQRGALHPVGDYDPRYGGMYTGPISTYGEGNAPPPGVAQRHGLKEFL